MSGLEERRRRLAAAKVLLASILETVVLVGPDGLVREANPAALALLPHLRPGHPSSYGVRAPDILDAVAQARDPRATVRASP